MSGRVPACWVIGNPENRRIALFQEALQQAGLQPAHVIPYLALFDEGFALLDRVVPGSMLRIESPGENFEVEKRILALGGVAGAMQLEDELGRIHHPGAWYAGFSRLMEMALQRVRDVVWFNHPTDILTMFDKPRCKALLAPHTLAPCPDFATYAEFFAYATQQVRPRFFIKLNYSSSASGIVAYEYNRARREALAYSTVEVTESAQGRQYFNSLKIRKYRDHQTIRGILDFLFAQGALVEPWVPKATHDDAGYDLRVLAIAGGRQHTIARLSHGPMTNLHLGNRRCAVEDLALPGSIWEQIDTLVADSMRRFPRSLYAGLDVLLPRNGGAPVLLEANAFGDLLPNLLHAGRSTCLAEIVALCEREGIAHAA